MIAAAYESMNVGSAPPQKPTIAVSCLELQAQTEVSAPQSGTPCDALERVVSYGERKRGPSRQ